MQIRANKMLYYALKKESALFYKDHREQAKVKTITNIISECLSDGKKVLFVSEKMAALEVVHRRLTNAGLDDFCLILHSHKANKRAVL